MMSIMNTLLKLKAFGHQPNLFKLSVSSKMSIIIQHVTFSQSVNWV